MQQFVGGQPRQCQFNRPLQWDSHQHSKSDVYGAWYEDVGMMAHWLGPLVAQKGTKRDKVFRTMFGLSCIIEVKSLEPYLRFLATWPSHLPWCFCVDVCLVLRLQLETEIQRFLFVFVHGPESHNSIVRISQSINKVAELATSYETLQDV